MADFVKVCKNERHSRPRKAGFRSRGPLLLLTHVGGCFYAISDRCTHDDGPLGEGVLEGFAIVCPRHGAKFDVRDGRVLAMPATRATPAYEVKVEGDDVFVKAED